MILVTLGLLAPIAWLLWDVLAGTPLQGQAFLLIGGALLLILAVGLGVAAVTGYTAGLIGAVPVP